MGNKGREWLTLSFQIWFKQVSLTKVEEYRRDRGRKFGISMLIE